jgi:hypothetical protein
VDFFNPSARKSILDFSTKLPVGLLGLIKIKSLVLSVIKDKIFSGSNLNLCLQLNHRELL